MEEEVFLGLRKKSGLSLQRFEERFGQPFSAIYGDVATKLEADGLIQLEDDRLRMTKRGLFLGDTVAEKFILE